MFLDQAIGCAVPDLDHGKIQLINGFSTASFIPIGESLSGNVEIGSTLQFTCDRGYLLSGSRTSTCVAIRDWGKTIPTCSSKYDSANLTHDNFN